MLKYRTYLLIISIISIASANDVIAISTGAGHSLAIRTDNSVWSWGWNEYGQLGTNDTFERTIPAKVHGIDDIGFLEDVCDIGAGYGFSVALKCDGTVVAWGKNDYGQLGDGTYDTSRYTPVYVKDSSGTGIFDDVKKISVGAVHCLALKNDGSLWSWGSNRQGCLGIGTGDYEPHPLPVRVLDSTGTSFLSGVVDIYAGSAFSLAIVDDSTNRIYGAVYSWGANNSGQLGNDTILSEYLPHRVLSSDGTEYLDEISSISGTSEGTFIVNGHCLAIDSDDGSIWSWGRNVNGQLGDGTVIAKRRPTKVLSADGTDTLNNILKICAAMEHSIALTQDSIVLAWGDNHYGQLGINSSSDTALPVQVHGAEDIGILDEIVEISASHCHNLALKFDGTLWAWGKNEHGQIGDGTTITRYFPVQVFFEPLEVKQDDNFIPDNIDIIVHPNPFNSSCAIDLPLNAEIFIRDLKGNLIYKFSGEKTLCSRYDEKSSADGENFYHRENNSEHQTRTIVWTPDKNTPSGIYIISAKLDGNGNLFKKIMYIK